MCVRASVSVVVENVCMRIFLCVRIGEDVEEGGIAALVKPATYIDKMDEKLARPKRRRGAILVSSGR
jgi:hypothetical protein